MTDVLTAPIAETAEQLDETAILERLDFPVDAKPYDDDANYYEEGSFFDDVLLYPGEPEFYRRKRISPALRLGLGLAALAAAGAFVSGCLHVNKDIDGRSADRVATAFTHGNQLRASVQDAPTPVEIFGVPTAADADAARTQAEQSTKLAEAADEVDGVAVELGGTVLLAVGTGAIWSRRRKIGAALSRMGHRIAGAARSAWTALNEPLPAPSVLSDAADSSSVSGSPVESVAAQAALKNPKYIPPTLAHTARSGMHSAGRPVGLEPEFTIGF